MYMLTAENEREEIERLWPRHLGKIGKENGGSTLVVENFNDLVQVYDANLLDLMASGKSLEESREQAMWESAYNADKGMKLIGEVENWFEKAEWEELLKNSHLYVGVAILIAKQNRENEQGEEEGA